MMAALAAVLGFSTVATAHHSFAMFDMAKTIKVEGTVKDFQWTNPHVWIEVIATTPEGSKQYSVEGTAIRVLKGAGWKFNSLKPGDKVTVVMNPLRSGEPGGSLVSVSLPDGRTLTAF
jgi:hypothetical protein